MHGRSHILIAAALVLLAMTARGAEPVDVGRLEIALRPETEVVDSVVRIADVADISGGNSVQRERIGALDLEELGLESSTRIEPQQIEARLLLAGEAAGSFVITGSADATVSLSASHGAAKRALEAARKSVAENLSAPLDEVFVDLVQPLGNEVAKLISAADASEILAKPVAPIGGRTRIDLWMPDGRGGQSVRPIAVDVRFRQLAPVAARHLKARQRITQDDVTLETRYLPQRGAALTLDDVVGKTLRRTVATGWIVSEGDLVTIVDDKDPIVIRPRDVVRVTAKKRNLTLEMPAAEAMQAGRLGETIRVRNTATQKVIIGRVAGPGEVEVPL